MIFFFLKILFNNHNIFYALLLNFILLLLLRQTTWRENTIGLQILHRYNINMIYDGIQSMINALRI